MGCSNSRLDDEEAVQICRERKKFIKQAIEQRTLLASNHKLYVQALKRVSAALREFAETENKENLNMFQLAAMNAEMENEIIDMKTAFPDLVTSETIVKCLRADTNVSVSLEERPQSPENMSVRSYTPIHHYDTESSTGDQYPMYTSIFDFPYGRTDREALLPPQSPPKASQWDLWNPFLLLDSFVYPTDTTQFVDEEDQRLKMVREEEGIPDLEDETVDEKDDSKVSGEQPIDLVHDVSSISEKEVHVEPSGNSSSSDASGDLSTCRHDMEILRSHDVRGLKSQGADSIKASAVPSSVETDASFVDNKDSLEGEIISHQGPVNFAEVIENIENHFILACDCANEISILLEECRTQFPTATHEIAVRTLNPIALIRAPSLSSSSRTLQASSSSRDDSYDSRSDFTEEACTLSWSHRSTMERLYAWEKKLSEEVRGGEQIRILYEKKCRQLREHDARGDDHSSIDKTRLAIRDLHTRLKVSIHSIESVSNRIEVLRDEELQPQLTELIHGFARMWRTMNDCHQAQKLIMLEVGRHTGTPKLPAELLPGSHHRAAVKLKIELANWWTTFGNWITSQRAYVRALLGWSLNCLRLQSDTSSTKPPNSPYRIGAPPVVTIASQWASALDSLSESRTVDSLRTFASNLHSLYLQDCEGLRQRGKLDIIPKEHSIRMQVMTNFPTGRLVPNKDKSTDIMTVTEQLEEYHQWQQDMAETAISVIFNGLSIVTDAISEFSEKSAEAFSDLEKMCEKIKQMGYKTSNQQLIEGLAD